jgi:hypothetical protein
MDFTMLPVMQIQKKKLKRYCEGTQKIVFGANRKMQAERGEAVQG